MGIAHNDEPVLTMTSLEISTLFNVAVIAYSSINVNEAGIREIIKSTGNINIVPSAQGLLHPVALN